MNKKLFIFLTAVLLAAVSTFAQQNRSRDDQLPLFELDEVEVIYSPTDFAPSFGGDAPQLSYYEVPSLPGGDLILALEFMDRYRDTLVPGRVKWAGMLLFPVIDGEERKLMKWLCLYYYNDKMYGYDPSGKFDEEKRFFIPIKYEDRRNQDVLFRFATNFVEDVFPERDEEYYYVETSDPTDPDAYFEETWDTITIPAGRIDGFLTSHKGKEPRDLVRIVYEHSEIPNPGMGSRATMGEPEKVGKKKFTWASFIEEFKAPDDQLDLAAELLKPRWTQRVRFIYENKLLFWDIKARSRGLLFNIGTKIYTYSPKWGVWRTKATIYDLEDRKALAAKLEYPGVSKVLDVEFITPEVEESATKE